MRRVVRVVSLVAVIALLGAACGKKSSSPTPGAAGRKRGVGTRVCEVSGSGGFNDKSFNQTAHEGVTDAVAKLGVKSVFLESKTDQDYGPNVNTCGQQNANLTVTVGFLL